MGGIDGRGRQGGKLRAALLTGSMLGCVLAGQTPARAENFNLGDATISIDTTLSTGVGIRTRGPNQYFLDAAQGGIYNGSSGPADANWTAGRAFHVL